MLFTLLSHKLSPQYLRLRKIVASGLMVVSLLSGLLTSPIKAQGLELQLQSELSSDLVAAARISGDAQRGAILFFQQQMACSKCHSVGDAKPNSLGPDLAKLGAGVKDTELVEAVLLPSKSIRKGYESVTVVTKDGKSLSALLIQRTPDQIVIRDIQRTGEETTIAAADIEEFKLNTTSIMPSGQVNQLNSRQQFLDLIRYLIEIRDGGPARAKELQPPASLLTFTVPEYEQQIDHAGLISKWNAETLKRGEAIYQRVCANCHGTKDRPGSLPTSLRFAEGKFKNGSDPLSMYRTMTYGFGLMMPQTWMVPSQKYDVIHYIRETYLKPHNPGQFVSVDADLIARLPKGDTLGPEPSKIVPWSAMDYGSSLAHTYEVPGLENNIAYKGIAVRLDAGAGGVSRGRHWMMFDTDTLRTAAAWNGSGYAEDNFIDWQGIQFNGAHNIHPRTVGQVVFANSTGPGWADPATKDFADDQRVLGRDGKRYGPLPRKWGQYRGQYHYGQQVVYSYTVGTTEILESPSLMNRDSQQGAPVFLRTFNIGPRDTGLVLQVAENPARDAQLEAIAQDHSVVMLAPPHGSSNHTKSQPLAFDGNTYLQTAPGSAFDFTTKDFSIVARIRTKADGTIVSLTQPGPKWIPDGQTLFVRDGRLSFDIGWVGAVSGKSKIDDGKWHVIAATWQKQDKRLRLYVDGKLDGEGTLAAKQQLSDHVVRIGFTSPNFPQPESYFRGSISEVRIYQQQLTDGLETLQTLEATATSLTARWQISEASDDRVVDESGHEHTTSVHRGAGAVKSSDGPIVAGFAPRSTPAEWTEADGKLRLRIPAGREPIRFTIWVPSDTASVTLDDAKEYAERLVDLPVPNADRDLHALTGGGPARWPQRMETQVVVGSSDGAFASDILMAPESNPWLAQTRFTGLDFFPDGRIAVCSWDGDVWIVEPTPSAFDETSATSQTLRWQRIATGMFQPLGLKIVDGKIHVTCRDQLAVLHDLNDDGETDFYECFNNDHQVTEHFHEFAMGLQTDADGNFYYAKSGEHGKPAVVPHHGTLLRVTKDGSRTDILANGFRAANGVCLNPDGSFVVTDQEGFWNPKNRINWVTLAPSGKPKFYGNMLGYHDVTDTSDSAMEPPLCWITNAFDRSPGELLWVDSERWGPLNGSLLNLSYGYGKVFLVPHENVNETMQGGMIELPIPTFPTGVMRGRFHPLDRQLYLCGMFAWAGNATYPGGLYRLRATGQPMRLPLELHATSSGLKITFTEALDPKSFDVKNLHVRTWSLKRSAKYGSEHYDEMELQIRGATLSDDCRTLTIDVADLKPTWGMEIKYTLQAADGAPVIGTIHNTIHALSE